MKLRMDGTPVSASLLFFVLFLMFVLFGLKFFVVVFIDFFGFIALLIS
jgi:hypothetical protein